MTEVIRRHWTILKYLLWQDLKLRFTGTWLGWFWLVLQPLSMLFIYTFIFGEVLQLRHQMHDVPSYSFALYLFVALMAFNAIAEVLSRSPTLLQEQRALLLNSSLSVSLLPWLVVVGSLLTELMALVLFLLWGVLMESRVSLWGIFLYLPWLLLRLSWSWALAMLISHLGVFWQDLRQLVPAALPVLLLVSPVLYPLALVPESWQALYSYNPITTLVQGYQQALIVGHFDLGLFVQASIFTVLFMLLCQQWVKVLGARVRLAL